MAPIIAPVEALGRLAHVNVGRRVCRDQLSWQQQLVKHLEYPRVLDNQAEHGVFAQQCVDASGAETPKAFATSLFAFKPWPHAVRCRPHRLRKAGFGLSRSPVYPPERQFGWRARAQP